MMRNYIAVFILSLSFFSCKKTIQFENTTWISVNKVRYTPLHEKMIFHAGILEFSKDSMEMYFIMTPERTQGFSYKQKGKKLSLHDFATFRIYKDRDNKDIAYLVLADSTEIKTDTHHVLYRLDNKQSAFNFHDSTFMGEWNVLREDTLYRYFNDPLLFLDKTYNIHKLQFTGQKLPVYPMFRSYYMPSYFTFHIGGWAIRDIGSAKIMVLTLEDIFTSDLFLIENGSIDSINMTGMNYINAPPFNLIRKEADTTKISLPG